MKALLINRAHYTPYILPNTGEFGRFGISGIIGSLVICTALYVLFSIVLTGVVNNAVHAARKTRLGTVDSVTIFCEAS